MTRSLTTHVFFCVSMHLEAELLTQEEIWNGNARVAGNTIREIRIKIEFQQALTVKRPKILSLVPRSLCRFPNPLLILDLSTPALSYSS